jgi:tryptophan synthase alpha chain
MPADNRISSIFETLRASGRKGLMPFVCGGHGRPGLTAQVLPALDQAGASIIEVGIPFSDPIADGPVIASAMHQAIQPIAAGGGGATPMSVFDEVAASRASVKAGLVAMVSVSIVHRMGSFEGFSKHARNAGFDGMIIPDLPVDEAQEAISAAANHGLTLSLLIAPTTPADRVERIARSSTGFAYLLARAGITGERAEVPDISPLVAGIRRASPIPIACGFGISSAEHVRSITRHADAAIVGSVLVRRMHEAWQSEGDPVEVARGLVSELARGLD